MKKLLKLAFLTPILAMSQTYESDGYHRIDNEFLDKNPLTIEIMSKIKLADEQETIKIISFDLDTVHEATVHILKAKEEYGDRTMSEDLYSCEIGEDIALDFLTVEDSTSVKNDLEEIKKLCDKNEASYFRFIKP